MKIGKEDDITTDDEAISTQPTLKTVAELEVHHRHIKVNEP